MAPATAARKTLFAGVLCLLPLSSQAQYLPTDWNDTTAAGSAFALTAWPVGGHALFYNPAGLSILHNKHSKIILDDGRLPLPDEAEANEQMMAGAGANPQGWFKDTLTTAHDNPGMPSYAAAQAFPYVLLGGKNLPAVLIGFPIRAEQTVVFIDPTNPNNASINDIGTASGALGISDTTQLGVFRWGVSARPNTRLQYTTQTYDVTGDTTNQYYFDQIHNTGVRTTALALDAGIILTASDYWFPSLGIAVRNIPTGCIANYTDPITFKTETMCGTLRTGGNIQSPNESLIDPTEVRAGVSLIPRFHIWHEVLDLKLSADAYPLPVVLNGKNYGIPSIPAAHLIHAGGELFFGSTLSRHQFGLRGGYMNDAPTWGGSLRILLFNMGYASYQTTSTVQLSTNTIEQFTERRHMLYLGLKF